MWNAAKGMFENYVTSKREREREREGEKVFEFFKFFIFFKIFKKF